MQRARKMTDKSANQDQSQLKKFNEELIKIIKDDGTKKTQGKVVPGKPKKVK